MSKAETKMKAEAFYDSVAMLDSKDREIEIRLFDERNNERARCLKAVDDELEHIKGSWKPLVAEAKANIRKRIEEGL